MKDISDLLEEAPVVTLQRRCCKCWRLTWVDVVSYLCEGCAHQSPNNKKLN